MLLLVLRRWQGMQHGNECHLDDDPSRVMVRGRGSNHSKAQNKSDSAIQIDFRVPAGTDVMGPSESAGLLAQTV